MLKQFSLWIVATVAVLAMILGAAVAPFSVVHAGTHDVPSASEIEACKALEKLGGTKCGGEDAENRVIGIAKSVINILSIVVGIASVIVIVIAGLRFVTSGGDSNAVTTARSMILYAIIGLVIVIFAQAIVAFVLNRV